MEESELIENLKDLAQKASKQAYAVYSNFPVGVAFVNNEGAIFTGCNVENISFGLTNCAERTAIFKSVSEGNRTIDTLVIYTPTASPTPPCGACRQVIAEFNPKARIISICDTDQQIDMNLSDLLPVSVFNLNKKNS